MKKFLLTLAAAVAACFTVAKAESLRGYVTFKFDTSYMNGYPGKIQVKPRADYLLLSDIDNRPLRVITSETGFYDAKQGTVGSVSVFIPSGTHVDQIHVQIRVRIGNNNTETYNALQLNVTPYKNEFTIGMRYGGSPRDWHLAMNKACNAFVANESADKWVENKKKEIDKARYNPYKFTFTRTKPTKMNVTIKGEASGKLYDQKIRFDYTLRNSSTGKITEVKSWENKLNQYTTTFSVSAPSGQYIDQIVHVQVRVYDGDKWHNHETGIINIGDGKSNVVLKLTGSTSSGVRATCPLTFYYDGLSSTEWIDWMNEIKAGTKTDFSYGASTTTTREAGTVISGTSTSTSTGTSTGTSTATGTFYGDSSDGRAGLIVGLVAGSVVVTGLTVGAILANTGSQTPAEIAAPVKTAPVADLCKQTPVYFKHVYPSGNDLTIDVVSMSADIYDANGNYLRTDNYSTTITASEPNRTLRIGPTNSNERVYKWAYLKIAYYQRGKQDDVKKLIETRVDLTSGEKDEIRLVIKGSGKDNSMILISGNEENRNANASTSDIMNPIEMTFEHNISRSDKTVDIITVLYSTYDDQGNFIARSGFDVKLDRHNTSITVPINLSGGATKMTVNPEIRITSGVEGSNDFKTIVHTYLSLKNWKKSQALISLTGSAQSGTVKLENGKESR